jgi:hypothetical protein
MTGDMMHISILSSAMMQITTAVSSLLIMIVFGALPYLVYAVDYSVAICPYCLELIKCHCSAISVK